MKNRWAEEERRIEGWMIQSRPQIAPASSVCLSVLVHQVIGNLVGDAMGDAVIDPIMSLVLGSLQGVMIATLGPILAFALEVCQ